MRTSLSNALRAYAAAQALMIAPSAYAFPPSGVNVALAFNIGTSDGSVSIGPQVSYINDKLFNHDNWSVSFDASVFAPILIYDLHKGTAENGLGTLTLQTQFIADPPGSLKIPQLPEFQPYASTGIKLTIGNGDPKLNYNLGLYVGPGRTHFLLDLPVLTYDYDLGSGSSFNYLFSSVDLSGAPNSCTSGLSGYDCTFTQATYNFSGSPVPEPGSWALGFIGFGLIGSALRLRPRKIRYAIA